MSSASQSLAVPRGGLAALLHDFSELTKLRVTSLIVMTAWTGFFFGSLRFGVSSVSLPLLHALFGIGAVSAGTAALNEVLERDVDSRMRRTSNRPLVTGRMPLTQGLLIGLVLVVGGSEYLAFTTNVLTALLTAATAAVYLWIYTPMKRVHPLCTFIGAFPGAMAPVLGWTAARGRLDPESLVLFAILFFWQFPHFHSIAWLYREDYERAGVRMLPVVDPDGKSTSRSIIAYTIALLLVTVAPTLMHMSGWIYCVGAIALGTIYLWSGVRLAWVNLPATATESKRYARMVLQVSVLYLPLLFALMMIDAVRLN